MSDRDRVLQKLKIQCDIEQFAVYKKLNYSTRVNYFPNTPVNSIAMAIAKRQITGFWPAYSSQIRRKHPQSNLFERYHAEDDSGQFTSQRDYQVAQTELLNYTGEKMGANLPTHSNAVSKMSAVKSGAWNIIGASAYNSQRQMGNSNCVTAQKFDHSGSLFVSGFSNGQILLFDHDEIQSHRLAKKDEILRDKSFSLFDQIGHSFQKTANERQAVPFFKPIVHFLPQISKPVQTLNWIGEESTNIVASFRLSSTIQLFDLERCPDILDATLAEPLQEFFPSASPSNHGTDTLTPIDVCVASENLIWSISRNCDIRLWDVRAKGTPCFQQPIGNNELTSLAVEDNVAWVTSSKGYLYAIDVRKQNEGCNPVTNARNPLYYYSLSKMLHSGRNQLVTVTENTRHICTLKIVDKNLLCTASADGTVVLFDPYESESSRSVGDAMTNGKLKAFYQPEQRHHREPRLLSSPYSMDIIPRSSATENALVCMPSVPTESLIVIDLFGKYVDVAALPLVQPKTIACHPRGQSVSFGENSVIVCSV